MQYFSIQRICLLNPLEKAFLRWVILAFQQKGILLQTKNLTLTLHTLLSGRMDRYGTGNGEAYLN